MILLESESDAQFKAPHNDLKHPLDLSSDSDIPPNLPAATPYTCLSDRMPGSLTTTEFSAQSELSCSVSSDDPIHTLTKIFHTILLYDVRKSLFQELDVM